MVFLLYLQSYATIIPNFRISASSQKKLSSLSLPASPGTAASNLPNVSTNVPILAMSQKQEPSHPLSLNYFHEGTGTVIFIMTKHDGKNNPVRHRSFKDKAP